MLGREQVEIGQEEEGELTLSEEGVETREAYLLAPVFACLPHLANTHKVTRRG